MFVDVGAHDDFVEGVPTIVTVEGREVGIVRWRGELFAIRNVCPHQQGPICRGYLMPLIVSGADVRLEVDDDSPVIVCPWHAWEFDVRTGRAAWAGGRSRLRVYPVKEDAGRVLVDVRASVAPHVPARAE